MKLVEIKYLLCYCACQCKYQSMTDCFPFIISRISSCIREPAKRFAFTKWKCPVESNNSLFSLLWTHEMRFECYQLCKNSASKGKHKTTNLPFTHESPHYWSWCWWEYNIVNHLSCDDVWKHDIPPGEQSLILELECLARWLFLFFNSDFLLFTK